MHIRNIFNQNSAQFKTKLTLSELSDEFPKLKHFLKYKKNKKQKDWVSPSSHCTFIDFKDPNATRAYNEALLKKYFDLSLEFLPGSLCPAIPNRLNYIHWIEDVLNVFPGSVGANNNKNGICGLDIGTGSSCIYPLLICRTHSDWRMSGSDINSDSIEIAKKNVQNNRLIDRIQLFLTKDKKELVLEGQIFQPHLFFNSTKRLHDEKPARFCYDFTMCNPPFYSDIDDLNKSRQAKATTIRGGAHEGVSSELFTTGGELLFLSQMVEESFLYKDKVGWFTTMTGKKSTALEILNLLGQHQIQETIASELIQGKTIRWVIGWTFHKDLFDFKHPSCNTLKLQDIHYTKEEEIPASKRICLGKISLKSKEHIPSKQLISSRLSNEIGWTKLKSRLGDLFIEFSPEKLSLVGKVVYPTWTRAWRRNGKAKSNPTPFSFSAHQTEAAETVIQLEFLPSESEKLDENALLSFQSLCNHLRSYLKD